MPYKKGVTLFVFIHNIYVMEWYLVDYIVSIIHTG